MIRPTTNTTVCRACGAPFGTERLLRYTGMPCGAQNFPDATGLARDHPVDLELAQCTPCGVVQLLGEPVPYWRDVIRAVGVSGEMRDFRQQQFDDFVRRHGLKGRPAIEFGCGDGAFVSLLEQSGLRVLGLEHSQEQVERCRQKGLPVSQGFAGEHGPVPGGPFDAFFIFSVLEHMPDVRAFLAAVRGNLSEGAAGIIEVPNFDMIVQGGLFAEFIIDHLCYFTHATFIRTLENNGFEVLSCTPARYEYILSAEVRKRSVMDTHTFSSGRSRATKALSGFLARYDKVAVWGAGHQSFTLLAMLPAASRIAYIVDSAPFKRGRYSPCTHIPIVAPETLKADPVQSLIVIGGSYSREIAALAREQYGQKNILMFINNTLIPYENNRNSPRPVNNYQDQR